VVSWGEQNRRTLAASKGKWDPRPDHQGDRRWRHEAKADAGVRAGQPGGLAFHRFDPSSCRFLRVLFPDFQLRFSISPVGDTRAVLDVLPLEKPGRYRLHCGK